MNTTYIRPKKTFSLKDLIEVWKYKELLYFLSWRDIKVRYKQTFIGIGWAVLQPFITMVVFSIFFGKLAGIPSDGAPYPIFVYSGLLFWQFFSSSLADTSNILIANQNIITKVYFPRLVLPLSSVITKLIDFAIAGVILFGLMLYYGYYPSLSDIFILPILLAITFMASIGSGLILSAINIKYRDVRYVLPFFIQMLLFVTPVIYPTSIAGEYEKFLSLNPMTGVIENARAILLNTGSVDWALLGISALSCFVLLVVGIYVFKKVERFFADII